MERSKINDVEKANKKKGGAGWVESLMKHDTVRHCCYCWVFGLIQVGKNVLIVR